MAYRKKKQTRKLKRGRERGERRREELPGLKSLAASMGLAERSPILGIEALPLKIGFANLWEGWEQRTYFLLAMNTVLK